MKETLKGLRIIKYRLSIIISLFSNLSLFSNRHIITNNHAAKAIAGKPGSRPIQTTALE